MQQQQQHSGPISEEDSGSLLQAAREANLFYYTPVSRWRCQDGELGDEGATRQSGFVDFVYKLESVQPSGSFKDRGIGYMIQSLKARKEAEGKKVTLLICSSGGNAGLSVAYAGQTLGIPTHIVVPITTPDTIIDKLRLRSATVTRHGENWNAADLLARDILSQTVDATYIPPFNDPLIWEGHSTIVAELFDQLKGVAPAAIVLSVGGGGLLRGVQMGLEKIGWLTTKIVAVETNGAASFAAAKKAGVPVRIAKIDTIAKTLGALEVIPSVLTSPIETISFLVDDRAAMRACYDFLHEHRILVEPACGASLSLGSNAALRSELFSIVNAKTDCKESAETRKTIVFICCGGSSSLPADVISWA